jgi:peptide/nickel transport system substrate-binding protein
MKKQYSPLILALVILVLGVSQPSRAAECVRVVGYEPWTGQQTIDPAFNTIQTDVQLIMALYEPLIWVDNNFGLVPRLAKSWEANADGTVWTFKLQEGVKFHDGSDFDAEDVVYTYRRLIAEETASPASAVLGFLTAEGIEAVDSHTVKFTANTPTAELPFLLSNKFALIVSSDDTTAQIKNKANGTGPFTLDEFSPAAVRLVMHANPSYWQEGLPKSDCLELSSIAESVARAAAVMAGQADVLLAVDASTVISLGDDAKVTIAKTEAGPLMMMWMMTDVAPYDDVRVRKAMKLVIDREKMVELALLGYGSPGNDNPIPPSSPAAYRSDVIQQDIPQAKALLAEAGYPNGLKVDLYTGATDLYPGTLVMVQAYKEMASEAGIDVTIIPAPNDSYWDEIWMKKPFTSLYWSLRPPSSALPIAYTSDAPYNGTHWYNKEFDNLVATASKTVDADKRGDLYREAQRLLAEDGGHILPMFSSVVSLMREGCSGFQPHTSVNRVQYQEIHCD